MKRRAGTEPRQSGKVPVFFFTAQDPGVSPAGNYPQETSRCKIPGRDRFCSVMDCNYPREASRCETCGLLSAKIFPVSICEGSFVTDEENNSLLQDAFCAIYTNFILYLHRFANCGEFIFFL